MKVEITSFRGEVPRLTPRALPDNAAQVAINARLQSGDLEAWRQFTQTKVLANSGAVQTIYLLNDKWLSWTHQVDVARGVIPGDTSAPLFLTCPSLYGKPQFTNYAMATTGAEPHPVATRPLGVPSPDTRPTVEAVAVEVDEAAVPLVNPGGEAGSTTGWTNDVGAIVVHENGDIVGLNAHGGTQFFGGGTGTNSEARQDKTISSMDIQAGSSSLALSWWQATGAAGSKAAMALRFYDAANTLRGEVVADLEAPPTPNTWAYRQIELMVPATATTARLVQIYERVGAGPEIDAYIDDVVLIAKGFSNVSTPQSYDGWSFSGIQGGPGNNVWSQSGADSTKFFFGGDTACPWMIRDFGSAAASGLVVEFDFWVSDTAYQSFDVVPYASAGGAGTGISFGLGALHTSRFGSLGDRGTGQPSLQATGFGPGPHFNVKLTCTKSEANTALVVVRVENLLNGAVLVDDVSTTVPIDGPCLMLRLTTGSIGTVPQVSITAIKVQVGAPTLSTPGADTATSYVYRFRNDLGWVSAPSPESATVLRPAGGSVTVTTPTSVDVSLAAYGITHKEIYRAISGASGAAFVYVGETTLAEAAFSDAYEDNEIARNDVLNSEGWDLPPDDLQGIMVLPNGMLAGFRRNQLCLSVSGYPYAWRAEDRKTTDADIVAIRNIDNTIVIGTKSFVYTATGNSNDAYSMSMPGALQACVAKRGMVFLDGIGVVFPSPDGWMACAGSAGALTNITEGFFKKEQWEALDPSSIIAAVHDGMLVWFSTGQTPDSGFALDVRQSGFGLIGFSFHAAATYVDPLTDSLHMVLDSINEPADDLLPVASTAPTLASPAKTIFKFDGATNGDKLRYRYRGKLNEMPHPVAMTMAQVRAGEFTNLVFRVVADGTLLSAKAPASLREFRLPMSKAHDEYEIELVGTSRVRSTQVVEDVLELT